jgi:hypothetical protein
VASSRVEENRPRKQSLSALSRVPTASPRPYWEGYLKLSLVSCPIVLYTATSSGERVAFRQINKKTGNRLRQQLIDEGTSDPIDPNDKGRDFEAADRGAALQGFEHAETLCGGRPRMLSASAQFFG